MMKKTYVLPVVSIALVVGIVMAWNSSRLYLYSPEFAGSHTYNLLFNSAPWAVLYSAGLGISLGAVAAKFMRSKAGPGERGAERRGAGLLLEDLGMAFSLVGVIVLLVTGTLMGGFMTPRLFVDHAEAIGFLMNVHFVGIVSLLFGVVYLATRTVVSGDYRTQLARLGNLLGVRRQEAYLPSFSWAMLTLVFAAVALGVKGSGLLAEQVLGLPREIAVITSMSHDVLGLATIVPALLTVSLIMKERLAEQRRPASQSPQSSA